MRFLHTADLHIGKVVNEFSMLKEQEAALDQICSYAASYQVSAVILAGDLYDRSIPPAEAVTLMDAFLTRLADLNICVMGIAGNHDSPERIGFASQILAGRGLYLSGTTQKELCMTELKDEYGAVRFYLLPFSRPTVKKELYGKDMPDFEAGVLAALSHNPPEPSLRNVLVAHEFVTAKGADPVLSDSEVRVSVGGSDRVDAGCFAAYDYTALGHIHRCQRIGEGNIWYAGSPVKYSFSECGQDKSVNLVELGKKGEVKVTQLPLKPLHDMHRIRGSLKELTKEEIASLADRRDYLAVELTDEEELFDPMSALRSVYPNVMQLSIVKNLPLKQPEYQGAFGIREKDELELFEEFFLEVTGRQMDERRREMFRQAADEAKEKEI